MTILQYTLQGIPCQIEVTDFIRVKGSFSYNAPSDMDYRGYTDFDWHLLDRKGYKAPWLEKKLTPDLRRDIESFIDGEMT